jgi:hypothetical protein
MMGFLARWARRLSWRETARVFQTSWEAVYRSVEWFVEWGLAHRELRKVESIGVDEIHSRFSAAWTMQVLVREHFTMIAATM